MTKEEESERRTHTHTKTGFNIGNMHGIHTYNMCFMCLFIYLFWGELWHCVGVFVLFFSDGSNESGNATTTNITPSLTHTPFDSAMISCPACLSNRQIIYNRDGERARDRRTFVSTFEPCEWGKLKGDGGKESIWCRRLYTVFVLLFYCRKVCQLLLIYRK